MHILVVDDDHLVRETLIELLVALGHTTAFAINGQDAIALFTAQQRAIDAVILDMKMLPMSGEELFIRLKAIQPNVKVFLSTGFVEDDVAARLMRQGLLGILTKPYRVAELRAMLSKATT